MRLHGVCLPGANPNETAYPSYAAQSTHFYSPHSVHLHLLSRIILTATIV